MHLYAKVYLTREYVNEFVKSTQKMLMGYEQI